MKPVPRSLAPPLLALALLGPLLGCIEVDEELTLRSNGSGRADVKLAIDKSLAEPDALEKVKKQMTGSGWTLQAEGAKADKQTLTFRRDFARCSELDDKDVRHTCESAPERLFRRLHVLKVEQLRAPDFPMQFTLRVSMPGRVERTDGTRVGTGGVRWERQLTAGSRFNAASSALDWPDFKGLSPVGRALAVLGLLCAAGAVAAWGWVLWRLRASWSAGRAVCRACRKPVGAGAGFCRHCGSEVPASISKQGGAARVPRAAWILALGLSAVVVAVDRYEPASDAPGVVRGFLDDVVHKRWAMAQARHLSDSLWSGDSESLLGSLAALAGMADADISTREVRREGTSASVEARLLTPVGTSFSIPFTPVQESGRWRIGGWGTLEAAGDRQMVEGNRLCSAATRAQALASFDAALAENPADSRILLGRGSCQLALGDRDGADASFRKAIALHPEQVVLAYQRLARLLYGRDEAGAEQALEHAIRNCRPEMGFYEEPTVVGGVGGYKNAAGVFVWVSVAGGLYAELASFYAQRGIKLERAVQLAQKAVALDPDNEFFLDTLGWAYHRKGDREAALKHLAEALRRAPDNAAIRAHHEEVAMTADELVSKGDHLAGQGRLSEAIERYNAALRKSPDHYAAAKGREMAMNSAVAGHLDEAERLLAALQLQIETSSVRKTVRGSTTEVALKIVVSGVAVRPSGDAFSKDLVEDVETFAPSGEKMEGLSREGVLRDQGRTTLPKGATSDFTTTLTLDSSVPPGTYTVRLTIHDLASGQDKSHDLTFEMP